MVHVVWSPRQHKAAFTCTSDGLIKSIHMIPAKSDVGEILA